MYHNNTHHYTSAIHSLVTKYMKTIFDFNPTEQELDDIIPSYNSKDDYLKDFSGKNDSINLHLAMLFAKRNNKLRMYWYLSKVSDKQLRFDFLNAIGGF